MGIYTHDINKDKKAGDGLALSEWNDLRNAVAGHSGLGLALNAADKVGIGTGTPTNKLSVSGSSSDTTPILGLWGGNSHSHFNNGAQIAFGYNGKAEYQHFIHTRHNGQNSSNAIDFYVCNGTKGNTVTSGSIHTMSLVSGKVGIGTKSPTKTLEVNGEVKASKFSGDGSGLTNLSVGLTGLNLATTSGNVGIGTTNPSHKLHVKTGANVGLFESTDTQAYLRLSTSEGFDNRVEFCNRSGGKAAIWVKGAGDAITVLPTSGNVGIGTQNPSFKLTVNCDKYGIAHTNKTVQLSTFLDSRGGWIGTKSKHQFHLYSYDSSPALTVAEDKKIGIGTTSPTAKLHVEGNLRFKLDTLSDMGNTMKNDKSDNLLSDHSNDTCCIYYHKGSYQNYLRFVWKDDRGRIHYAELEAR